MKMYERARIKSSGKMGFLVDIFVGGDGKTRYTIECDEKNELVTCFKEDIEAI